MAARNRRPSTSSAGPGSAHDSLGLHYRASQHREDLLEEARTLQAAGKVRQARAVQKRAEQVGQLVGALEVETGRVSPEA
jgi:hypothetical protein